MLSIRDANIAREQGRGMAEDLTPTQLEHIGRGIAEVLLAKQFSSISEAVDKFTDEDLEIIGYQMGRAMGALIWDEVQKEQPNGQQEPN